MRKCIVLVILSLAASCAHAQQKSYEPPHEPAKPRLVYMIAEVKVFDEDTYSMYSMKVPAIVKKYGGRYLVRGGNSRPFFGGWTPERLIVIEFDNIEQLQKCFNSPEYLELKPYRDRSTVSKAVIVEGA